MSPGRPELRLALGVLLTPLAALLAFVDPGLAKDADCEAVLSGFPPVIVCASAPLRGFPSGEFLAHKRLDLGHAGDIGPEWQLPVER